MSWLSIFGKAGKPAEQKAVDLTPVQRLASIVFGTSENPYTYEKAVTKGFLGTDVVYSGVDLIASSFASVPLQVKEMNADGEMVDATSMDAQRLRTLLNRPNILQSGSEWKYAEAAFRTLGGDGYTRLVTSSTGQVDEQPTEMYPVSPSSVSMQTNQSQLYYQYTPNGDFSGLGGMAIFPIDGITGNSNIMQWGSFNPKTIAHGTSPLEAANTNIDIYREGNIWNKMYFKNGCKPSFAIESTAADGLSDDEFNRLKQELNDIYSGLENGNGKPMLLERAKPHNLSASAKDADFSTSHDQMARDITRSMKIPPILLNIGGDSTFTNQESAQLWFWENTIIPMVESFVEVLNFQLTGRYGDTIVIVPDFSGVVALEPRREQAWKRANEASFITVNEKRKMVGLDKIPGGDMVLIPSGMIPLEVAGAFTNMDDTLE